MDWDLVHLFVGHVDPSILLNLGCVLRTSKNVLEVQSIGETLEGLAILEDSLLLESIGDEAVDFGGNLDLLAHPIQHLPLDGVHHRLDLHDLVLATIYLEGRVKVQTRADPPE